MIYTKVQYISQGQTAANQEKNIRTALDHGIQWIQLRWKEGEEAAFYALAEKIKALCSTYKASLIINDHVAIAQAISASGVHLGLKDDSVALTRQILGPEKIIGGTANTYEEVLQRIDEGCDYIGLGPFRFTLTKKNLRPTLGLEGYRQLLHALQENNLHSPPIYAIGGIRVEDIIDLKNTGLYGIALSSLLTVQPQLIPQIKTLIQ